MLFKKNIEEVLNKVYNNLNKVDDEAISYIKNLNMVNMKKNFTNGYFINVVFINIIKYTNKDILKYYLSKSLASIGKFNIFNDNNILYFVILVVEDIYLEDYINILHTNIEPKNFVIYYEFLNFKKIPYYLFPEEFLIKNNINLVSNNDILTY